MIKIFIATMFLFLFVNQVRADEGPRSIQTTFYFQKNGKPITVPVKFSVRCYIGDQSFYRLLSKFSENCKKYGCKYDTTSIFYGYLESPSFCNLEGNINGNQFIINDFLGPSMSKLNCHDDIQYNISSSMGINNRYYQTTDQYDTCKEKYRNSTQNPDEICHKYLKDITSSMVLDKSGYPFEEFCEVKVNITTKQ